MAPHRRPRSSPRSPSPASPAAPRARSSHRRPQAAAVPSPTRPTAPSCASAPRRRPRPPSPGHRPPPKGSSRRSRSRCSQARSRRTPSTCAPGQPRGRPARRATSARRRSPASTVLGQAVTPSGNVQLPLADWGTLDVLSSTRSTSDVPRSAESTVTGLRVRLIAEHDGLPAGTEIVVGSATVRAVAQATPTTPPPAHIDGAPRAAPTVPATSKPSRVAPPPNAPKEPGRSIPGAPPEVVRAAPEVTARLSRGRLRVPGLRPRRVRQQLRRVPRRRRRQVAPRRGPRRAGRDAAPGRRGRNALLRRVERHRGLAAVATGRRRERVLLRAPERLLAARHRREAGEGGRRARASSATRATPTEA